MQFSNVVDYKKKNYDFNNSVCKDFTFVKTLCLLEITFKAFANAK